MSSFDDSGSDRQIGEVLAAMLVAAADAVRSWSNEDVASFLAGDRALTITRGTRSSSRRRPDAPEMQQLAEEVRATISDVSSREAGLAYVEQLSLNREALRALVLALDLPARKSDTAERLRERVVEALIGYRLRSRAIRGEKRTPRRDSEQQRPEPSVAEPEPESESRSQPSKQRASREAPSKSE